MDTWIVLADATRARVIALSGRRPLRLVRNFSHARGRLKGSAMTADKPGSVRLSAGRRAAIDRRTPAKEVEARHFADQLAHFLKDAHGTRFSELALVAPPHFLGLLRRAIGPNLRRTIVTAATKDLIGSDQRLLESQLAGVLATIRRAELEREQWA